MLRLEKVRKQYRDFELDCTMEVQPGCVTGLIGKNGAGKSTAFKASLGLIKLDGGEVKVFGVPVSKLGVKERQNIGVVLSDSGFSGYLSVQDIIPVLGSLYPNFQKGDFIRACEKMQIPLRKQLKEFSTGMKRKLQILAALSHEAKLLILDEPTAGLDIIAREQILDMLREYMEQDDKAILISSHISTDLEGFCDDIYMIDDGKIIFHEEADNLLDHYGLLKVTEEQYGNLDKSYILRWKKEEFGYQLLTDQKEFYMENYPQMIMEKGSIDELILMMVRGEE